VREHADPHLTCILVGNKIDLCEDDETMGHQREVPREEAEAWATEEGLLFAEASAKSGRNVEFAFEQAVRDILRKIEEGMFDDDRVNFFLSLIIADSAD
jgi:Ras-related protein Rab-2A